MTCVHLFMYICGGFGKNNGPSSHGSGLYSNKQSLRFRFEFSEAGFVDLNDELFVDDLIQEIENVSNSVYTCTCTCTQYLLDDNALSVAMLESNNELSEHK